MIRSLIAFLKIILFIFICLITLVILIPASIFIPRTQIFKYIPLTFHKIACLIFGIKITMTGTPSPSHQQTVYVGNHLSYADIPVLGSFLKATFISKGDVANWPLFGTLAKYAGTVFIGRSRHQAQKAIETITTYLQNGNSFILFPEGTSTNGEKVILFKSSAFDIFLRNDLKENLMVQPFTISLMQTNNHPIKTNKDRDLYCWYGDMEFTPHIWTFAQNKGAHLHITLHKPKAAKDYDERKKFAKDCHHAVQSGLINPLDTTKTTEILDLSDKAA